ALRHGALGQKAGIRLRLLAAQNKQLVGQHRRLRQAAAGKAVGLQLAPEEVQQLLLPLRTGGEHAVGHGPVPPAVLQGHPGIAGRSCSSEKALPCSFWISPRPRVWKNIRSPWRSSSSSTW